MRPVLNGIFHRNRTGCRWRMLPKEYGKWQRVYYDFSAWSNGGALARMNDTLREAVRTAEDREPTPSAGGIDRQTVKATEVGGDRGFDIARKATGQAEKRRVATDTLGLLLAVVVTGAGIGDAAGAEKLCGHLGPDRFPRLAKLWADGKYHNYRLYAHMRGRVEWAIEVVSRPPAREGEPKKRGWVTLPRRWVVERAFAWVGRCRANSKDLLTRR